MARVSWSGLGKGTAKADLPALHQGMGQAVRGRPAAQMNPATVNALANQASSSTGRPKSRSRAA